MQFDVFRFSCHLHMTNHHLLHLHPNKGYHFFMPFSRHSPTKISLENCSSTKGTRRRESPTHVVWAVLPYPPWKLRNVYPTWLAGKWTRSEDVFLIENGDFPTSHVSLLEGNFIFQPLYTLLGTIKYPPPAGGFESMVILFLSLGYVSVSWRVKSYKGT